MKENYNKTRLCLYFSAKPVERCNVSLVGRQEHVICVKDHPVEGDCWFAINFDQILKYRVTVLFFLSQLNK